MEGDAEAVALDLGLFAVGGLVAKDRNDHLEDEACFNRLVLVAKTSYVIAETFYASSNSKGIFCFEILYLNLNC